jgi:hypothetical protein
MNERIKKLADEAGLKYHNWITCESNINDGDFKYPRLEDYEKFAELIVREACLALWTEECHVSDLAFDEVKRAATRIKEHFGMDPREITTDMLDRSITWMQGQLADRGNK